ncbi:MAG: tRNA 2-thiouridine(34) synthase MnmA, partial [Candidatus Gastranaerophilales bacterium]|nr:tRNA 2-thiouridine(34) synthase MnmA [Candidatus Gastranaerophilales bacterium]
EKNEVIVGYEEDTFSKTLTAGSLNWILFEKLDKEMEVTAKIRSSQQPKNAVIRPQGENRVLVEFAEPQKAITPGQSVVFYSGDLVLGGGIID